MVSKKIQSWWHRNHPFAEKLMVISRILQALHIYYVSFWFPSSHVTHFEKLLREFLWFKLRGDRFLPLVPWEICVLSKDQGGLGLYVIKLQGEALSVKWIVRCLFGDEP